MRISYSWLSQYIDHLPEPEVTARLLTDCGLEVEHLEAYESLPGQLRGVLSGKVLEVKQHPNADRLRTTLVDMGAEQPLHIVCGAPNVAEGQKVLVATIGTTLHPKGGEALTIKESKIRGELSQGMICAEDELGIGESHAGIMVLPDETPVGRPAAEVLGLFHDSVFEIGLTPNRVDAASHFGVARDLYAICYDKPEVQLKPVSVEIPATASGHDTAIEIATPDALIRYSTLRISNARVTESPKWLREALLSIGLRPINNVVDVTNYVLHELGQPLHAFDHQAIRGGKLIVGTCKSQTVFESLDGAKHMLTESDLMICDAEGPLCMAGIYGGLHSGVTMDTREILLESATFHPVWVRKSSKHHNLKTDSSFRFERGTDPEATLVALYRAAQLITELTGGHISGGHTDVRVQNAPARELRYDWSEMDRLIGEAIPRDTAKTILRRLGMEFLQEDASGVTLRIPAFKVDVERSADITEEVLRVYGYNRIAIPSQVRNSISPSPKPDPHAMRNRWSDHLCGLGYFEVLNNSLSPSALSGYSAWSESQAVKLANPLSSELDILRMSMLPGLLENLAWNRNRQQSDVKFFEWGKTYVKVGDAYQEQEHLSLLLSGNDLPENVHQAQGRSGFFHLKGAVAHLLEMLGLSTATLQWKSMEHPALEQAYSWTGNSPEPLVILGSVHSGLKKHFDLTDTVYYAEFQWKAVWKQYRKARVEFREVPRFPSVRRDLALLMDSGVSYDAVEKLALQTERKLLREVNLFDAYQGDKLPEGKKSYAVSFVFQDAEQTLNDKVIEKTMQRLLQAFQEKLGAELRS